MMMNMTMQMMELHQKDMPMSGMDMSMMQECIEACSAAEQACTMCAGSMMGEDMMMCSGMCMNCADTCNTMMRMMMRPNGMHMDSMSAMLTATMAMCNACADECMKHAEMSEECRMCADVCRQCAMTCQKMMDAMKGMMPTA
ncbi:MAG: hypothetical protein JWQ59_1204 [Cryobacterium sp.]|jgi:hypothetical protein|nr:hypothetical protein [Cryobacterium sp.]